MLYAALAGLSALSASAQPQDPPAAHPFAASRPIAGRHVTFSPAVADPAAEAANQLRGVGAGGQLTMSTRQRSRVSPQPCLKRPWPG